VGEAAQIHPTAIVDEGAQVGARTRIWHFCHVMERARIGADCVLGQNVFVGRGVPVGEGTKIQNNVSLYEGVRIGKGCFIGPSAVFTNVRTPRAEVERKDAFAPTDIRDGATIGANATLVCGVTVGRYAVVGAGAMVTRDVADQRVVVGNPAREEGWACVCGAVLDTQLACPECGKRYRLREGRLEAGERPA
jgi:UDP-2-acetamido-3-amino-2,3-dideoxy-glucuronate N-acetyltransferase